MIGRTLSHYRIVEKIGAGGMGEVYRAHDERLERDVALKVLPVGTLTDEHARKRFRKEALALSKLNHPHIATVHDFDTQDGVDFLVMELVEGVTLSDKLAVGPLGEKEISQLGGQMAEALEEAHERGVVHRDLKPGNVMVTPKGQAKILDFGLAKLVRPVTGTATTESFTETQGVAGTVPYMAPEQLRGEQVDARSDIYAAGAVLYEMATGQRAFPETQGPRLIDAILNRAPQPPSGLNRRVSPVLENIILKALEKEPENRYQSAKELAVDLRRLGMPGSAAAVLSARRPATRRRMVWAAGVALVALLAVLVGLNVAGLRDRLLGEAGRGQITSIAVLPLENLSGDPEQDYFVDGMTETLITELSKIGALTVISRQSVMQFKGTDKPLPEIARELNVDAVVQGSALHIGERVRITVQLIEAASDRNLWAENYDRELRDILALHSDVARAIAREIKVAVTPEETRRLASARPVNPQAYEAYVKGRYFWNKATPEGIEKGQEYFQQAAEIDPTYALAYVGLADAYIRMGNYRVRRRKEVFPKAKAAALKAVELDEMLGEAHHALGSVKAFYERDRPGAEREYKRAIELNPGNSRAHNLYAFLLASLGRHEEALAEAQRARELDPFSLVMNRNVGIMYSYARRYDEAIEEYRKVIEMDPTFPSSHFGLGMAYLQKRMYDEGVEEFLMWLSLEGSRPEDVVAMGKAYASGGFKSYLRARLEWLKGEPAYGRLRLGEMAWLHAQLNEKDDAFEWLEKAIEDHETPNLQSPEWDSLRSDPRFQSLLRRLNFPEN
jgi:serine/threonine-protein kinase